MSGLEDMRKRDYFQWDGELCCIVWSENPGPPAHCVPALVVDGEVILWRQSLSAARHAKAGEPLNLLEWEIRAALGAGGCG